MKKLLTILAALLGAFSIPFIVIAVQISVPSAPAANYGLISTSTGNYLSSILPWSNVRLAKTTTYTVTNADKNKTIALGGNAFYTLTVNAASGYDSNFMAVVVNEDAANGKTIAINGLSNFILWPGETAVIYNQNNVWQVQRPLRYKVTSTNVAPLVLYVDPTNGADTNDGLTTGTALKKVETALLVACDQFDFTSNPQGVVAVDLLGNDVENIHYTCNGGAPGQQGGSALILEGTTPTTTISSTTGTPLLLAANFTTVESLTFSTTAAGNPCIQSTDGGYIFLKGNITFAGCSAADIQIYNGGQVQNEGSTTDSGAGTTAAHVLVQGGYYDDNGSTMTYTGNRSYSDAFVDVQKNSFAKFANSVFTLLGNTVSGTRYLTTGGGVLLTGGADPSTLPGSVNGTFKGMVSDYSSASTAFTGNVDVGTTTGDLYANAVANNLVLNNSGTNAGLSIFGGGSGNDNIIFGNQSNNNLGRIHYDYTNNLMGFWTNGSNERMVINSSGKVGIGTTSPQDMLSITGNLNLPATNFIGFVNGVPVTSSNYALYGDTVHTKLNVPSSGEIDFAVGNSTEGKFDSSGNLVETGGYLYANGAGTSFYSQNTANFRGNIANDTNTYLTIAGGTSGYTDFTGNVGIGTTTPDTKLAVVGEGSGSVRVGSMGCGSNYAGITLNGQIGSGCANYNFLSSPSDSTLYINRPTGSDVLFRENNSNTQLVLKSSTGNFGVGTSSPLSKLAVSGGASIGADYNFAAPTNGLIVEGNVGIGTTSPQSKLAVSGGASIGADYNTAAPTNSLIVEGTGAFGSTTAPTNTKLYLEYNANVNSGNSAGLLLQNYSTGVGAASSIELVSNNSKYGFLQMNGNGNTSYAGANSFDIGTIHGFPIGFVTSNTLQATLANGGVFDLGTSTATTGGHLNIWGKDGASAYMEVTNADAGDTSPSGDIFIVNGSGNVGVASSTPWKTFSVTGTAAFDGLTDVNTTGESRYLCLDANHQMVSDQTTCLVSSARYKNTIVPLTNSLQEVLAMHPVSFFYTKDPQWGQQVGFIAEQAQTVDPRLVVLDNTGKPNQFRYENFTALLAGAIQDIEGQIRSILARLDGDEQRITQQQKEIDHLQAQINQINKTL